MQCPNCGGYSVKVIDTMSGENDLSVYRRRKCAGCGTKFRTIEIIDDGSDEFQKGYFKAMENKSPAFKSTNDQRRARREAKKHV